jgi:polysaccharide biosynthesis transport protein
MTGQSETMPSDELDFGAVGRALWRKKWWVIVPTLLVGVIAFAGVNMATPKYKSEARILIEGRENVFLRPEADKQGDRDRAIDPEMVTSQVQLVLSRDLALKVINDLKLGELPEFDPVLRGISPLRHVLTLVGLAKDPLKMAPEERVLEAYYDRITAYAVDKSRVLAIEFQSSDPQLAASIVNAVAEGYLVLQQAAKQDQNRIASQWLSGEIASLRKKVAEAEAKVEEFRSKANLFMGTNNTSLSNQQLGEFNTQLGLARSQKAEAESKAKLISTMIKSGQPIESSDIINSELIRRLSEQSATLRAQLAEQSSTLLGNHPRIKELKAQIADLDRQIRREAERIVRSLENDARIAGARVESLTAALDQLKRQAASSNGQDVELRALEREAKAQRDLLESYLAKYREATARDSIGSIPTEARIISRGAVSNTPSFPKKMPIVLIATLATLLLASGFITTGELLAGNVYRSSHEPEFVEGSEPIETIELIATGPADEPDDAERVAGAVPRLAETRWQKADHDGAAAAAESQSAAAEPHPAAEATAETPATAEAAAELLHKSIAEIAGALRGAAEAGRRVSVIGMADDSGTTSTAVALARTLADDSRVVLIDLALASPHIATISTDPGAPGLADLIRGTASFRHIITRDRRSRVHLVGAGRAPVDSAAIMSSDRLAIAVDALARTYDHVVIDAGALPHFNVERFLRLASRAVLVTGDTPEDAAKVARDRLVAAGFVDVSLFVDKPPRPDETADAATAAA